MGFARGPKVFFDPEMQLEPRHLEPAATARLQGLGLGHLDKLEQPAVNSAGLRLPYPPAWQFGRDPVQ
jgi:hypothetical protein